jgi:hypothetical protein
VRDATHIIAEGGTLMGRRWVRVDLEEAYGATIMMTEKTRAVWERLIERAAADTPFVGLTETERFLLLGMRDYVAALEQAAQRLGEADQAHIQAVAQLTCIVQSYIPCCNHRSPSPR